MWFWLDSVNEIGELDGLYVNYGIQSVDVDEPTSWMKKTGMLFPTEVSCFNIKLIRS